ncbi:MAG: class I SAM-dependent methyltransferase [Bdellovibrio sp.]|nr:class I SAM-dependent methyltransferase [Bdellovibrio sp.]
MKRHILKQLKYVQLVIMNLFSKSKLPRTPEPSALTDQLQHVEEYNQAINTIMILPYVLVLDMIARLTDTKGLSFQESKKAIDLCCGPGHFTRLLASYGNCGEVTGVDLSEPMLEVAASNARKENLENKLTYIKSDVMSLEAIPSNSLDIVSFMDGAHHMNSINDVKKILTEAARVAKSSGLIVLLDPVRPKNLATADLYEKISGESYVEMGLTHFMKDFHDSIHASWKADELFEAIPTNTNRKWIQLVPFGFPAFQIVIGLPEGQTSLNQGKGLSAEAIAELIPKKYKADWDMLKLSFSLAKKNPVQPANTLT